MTSNIGEKYLTIRQMVESIEPDLVDNLGQTDWQHIGSFAAQIYRLRYGGEPKTTYEKRRTPKGIYYPKVPAYPVSFLDCVHQILALGYLK